jgi:hypothetical protein
MINSARDLVLVSYLIMVGGRAGPRRRRSPRRPSPGRAELSQTRAETGPGGRQAELRPDRTLPEPGRARAGPNSAAAGPTILIGSAANQANGNGTLENDEAPARMRCRGLVLAVPS